MGDDIATAGCFQETKNQATSKPELGIAPAFGDTVDRHGDPKHDPGPKAGRHGCIKIDKG
jgi:hypothetical protein